jgi:hypothetical protein
MLAKHGLTVRAHERRCTRTARLELLHSYCIGSGFGRVYFDGFVEGPGQHYFFFLTGTVNPLRWPFDFRVYRKVEKLLLALGAEYDDA